MSRLRLVHSASARKADPMTETTDPYPQQCPELLPGASGKPHLGALGNPYRCELGASHGGSIHISACIRWPNEDYVPRPKLVRDDTCPTCGGTGVKPA